MLVEALLLAAARLTYASGSGTVARVGYDLTNQRPKPLANGKPHLRRFEERELLSYVKSELHMSETNAVRQGLSAEMQYCCKAVKMHSELVDFEGVDLPRTSNGKLKCTLELEPALYTLCCYAGRTSARQNTGIAFLVIRILC